MNVANRRIAKNTVYMYLRLGIVTVVGLFSSRLVLATLGVTDYGLFAVVGGVLGLFTFLSSSLSTATSRFFNVEMGREDGDVNASFNVNLLLHTCFAVLIFILAETVGLWYVYNRLNVAEGKLGDAVFVYQISIVTVCLGIVNSPYGSLLAAHERFRFISLFDIVNSIVRFLCVLLLSFYQGEYALRIYGVIFSLTTVNAFVVYHYVAHRNWRDTIRLRFVRDRRRYREVLAFGGWNVLASVAYMGRTSGTDLMVNRFFGTAANGAFAIGKSVNQYIQMFTTNFVGASLPQIIQAYACGDRKRYTYLCNKLGRINLLLYELVAFPILIQLDFVLHLWLGNVPDGALRFTSLYIVLGGLTLTSGGVCNLINASGKIKWFKINISICLLSCIPLGIMLYHIGMPAYSILILFMVAEVVQRIVELFQLRYILNYDSRQYVRESYTRPAIIAALFVVGMLWQSRLGEMSALGSFMAILVCLSATATAIWTIGLTKGERAAVVNRLKRKHI